jgi:hypothetical protein
MSKNLSALVFMEQNDPALASLYKAELKEAKRQRSRERQRAMAAAYKEKEKDLEN